MLKGLKSESELLFISQAVDLPDATTVTREVNLPLNTLERQVFVVTDVMAYVVPSASQGSVGPNQTYDWHWSVSTTDLDATLSAAETGNIGNPRVLAAGGALQHIGGTGETTGLWTWGTDNATTGTPSDYLGIIATPDFFIRARYDVAVGLGSGKLFVRVVGYMATASADLYAALVTQEVNNS